MRTAYERKYLPRGFASRVVVGTKPTLSPEAKRTLLEVMPVVVPVVVPANLAALAHQAKANRLRLNRLTAAVLKVLLHRVTRTVA